MCSEDTKFLLVGTVPEESLEYPEIIVFDPDEREAIHVRIGIMEDTVWRWGVASNVSVNNAGDVGDGTTIDFDEPFQLMYECK